ncbi:hypothetical protein CC85DRAFT_302673 [Cutaneotrichosporon oleaginosum]|uniref:Uncharacterized protein n=1 Tax=Cutaneotrichosporon oleaginosum TaxID=879819 RepID=A0A0J0XLY7_9TREE|nr:uncharacterized protein CC85DRAFT_302673 [Cutaneotrichosporon oleaginosum]KLT42120.1 hypothetical protein CC85DRAFT_302673 [Cutaneotrichosporon oleaginosum]TXT04641.1 hypothetical protein COLE_07460 [Cutaneotrichosporon oleaginosum]
MPSLRGLTPTRWRERSRGRAASPDAPLEQATYDMGRRSQASSQRPDSGRQSRASGRHSDDSGRRSDARPASPIDYAPPILSKHRGPSPAARRRPSLPVGYRPPSPPSCTHSSREASTPSLDRAESEPERGRARSRSRKPKKKSSFFRDDGVLAALRPGSARARPDAEVIAELRAESDNFLRTLAHTEERLGRAETQSARAHTELARLRASDAALRDEVAELRRAALAAQKDAAGARENARHADAARERDAEASATRIARLEAELGDVRDRWRWLKEHTAFREAYSGFVGQQVGDYGAWEAFWRRRRLRAQGVFDEVADGDTEAGCAEFEAWLRFREDTEDAMRDALAARREAWDADVEAEREGWAADRKRWEEERAALRRREDQLRAQLEHACGAERDAVQTKIDNLTGYLRTSEAEQTRLRTDLGESRAEEARLRAALDEACATEARLRARLERRDAALAQYDEAVGVLRPRLETETRKHAGYRRAAAGLTRENERLKGEVARLRESGGKGEVSEDEFHETVEGV